MKDKRIKAEKEAMLREMISSQELIARIEMKEFEWSRKENRGEIRKLKKQLKAGEVGFDDCYGILPSYSDLLATRLKKWRRVVKEIRELHIRIKAIKELKKELPSILCIL